MRRSSFVWTSRGRCSAVLFADISWKLSSFTFKILHASIHHSSSNYWLFPSLIFYIFLLCFFGSLSFLPFFLSPFPSPPLMPSVVNNFKTAARILSFSNRRRLNVFLTKNLFCFRTFSFMREIRKRVYLSTPALVILNVAIWFFSLARSSSGGVPQSLLRAKIAIAVAASSLQAISPEGLISGLDWVWVRPVGARVFSLLPPFFHPDATTADLLAVAALIFVSALYLLHAIALSYA